MELYFTRHGKTEWNQAKKFQGMMGDSPLLPESYGEIQLLGEHIKDVPFEKIYASTSKRARVTAEGIQKILTNPAEIMYSDELRELGLGMLEGQPIEEMKKVYPKELEDLRFHLDRYDPTPFLGEPIEQALERISGVVKNAVKTSEGPLLFVGHGASLTAAIQWLAGKELKNLREMGGLFNNSLTILQAETPELPYKMELWNDISFLGDAKPDALL